MKIRNYDDAVDFVDELEMFVFNKKGKRYVISESSMSYWIDVGNQSMNVTTLEMFAYVYKNRKYINKRLKECKVNVRTPIEWSGTGKSFKRKVEIDSGVVDIVIALQKAKIVTLMSCDGHGKKEGYITLGDERILLILDRKLAEDYDRRELKLGLNKGE